MKDGQGIALCSRKSQGNMKSIPAFHFAALAYVGESVEKPAEYFENNVEEGVAMMSALERAGVRRLVLTSTAAVYGEPKKVPIVEDSEKWPKNPYGWSKLFLE